MAGPIPSRRRARTPPWWIWVMAAAHALYFVLLVTANLGRPEPTGLLVDFDAAGAMVAAVELDSAASRAGVQPGDRIVGYAGRFVTTRLDWLATDANLSPRGPVRFDLVRAGAKRTTMLDPPGRFVRFPPRRDTVVLALVLAGQLVTLLLAGLVAFRRPREPLAHLGALLLASMGVFTFVLPNGFAHLWRLMPPPVEWLLWLPFVAAGGSGVLFFLFCSEFPTRAFASRLAGAALALPAIPALAWHAYFGYVVFVREARIPAAVDGSVAVIALNGVYVAAGVGLLLRQHARMADPVERRRLRVLLAGAATGCASGALVAILYWVRPTPALTESLFGSPVTLVGVPLLLAVPGSIAYTLLRHRVLDVSLLLRHGVRRALARGLLLWLAPLLAVVLAADLLVHGREPLLDQLRQRGWQYGALAAVLVAVLVNRDRWLEAIDRRFFHAHYQAGQILGEVTGHLRHATDAREAIGNVVAAIHRALQPQLVAAIGPDGEGRPWAVLAALPDGSAVPDLRPDDRLVALASALGKVVSLSPDRGTWIHDLPEAEARRMMDAQVELVLAVPGDALGVVLVLGPRRSEGPYTHEDVTLLEAVGSSLALALDRGPRASTAELLLAECPACGACLDTSRARCPIDDCLLVATALPPVLNKRYRLLARLGSGGMGTVYSARDEVLVRDVAVKVLADHLVDSPLAARRFQQEAQATAAFDHPHVVAVHDFGVTASNRAFLVMERLHGATVRERLARDGPFDPLRTLEVVTDVCEVLEAAHGRGLVHRDLKPDNIFLAHAGTSETTKVLDFGIATMLEGVEREPGVGSTAHGVLVGSVPYMAPERLRGEPPRPSSDLWALAVTAHEMLSGCHPGGQERSGAGGPYDGVARAPLAEALRYFFASAFAADPAARPATARGFRDALAAALQLA